MTDPQNTAVEEQTQAAAEAATEQTAESTDPQVRIEQLKGQVEQLQQQLAEAKDQTLRTAAEAQNVRRRAEKDVENAHKYALEKFANAILPVCDNLERALESVDRNNEAMKSFIEGVELTHRSLLDALKKCQIEQIDPLGAPFDPQFHEAVSMVDNPAAEPNSVLHVMQKGFTLSGRLLRAAMVVVAKGTTKKIDETA